MSDGGEVGDTLDMNRGEEGRDEGRGGKMGARSAKGEFGTHPARRDHKPEATQELMGPGSRIEV